MAKKFSQYIKGQDEAVKERYAEKLNFIGPTVDDPHLLPIPSNPCTDKSPKVEYPDVYHYLISSPSPVTIIIIIIYVIYAWCN